MKRGYASSLNPGWIVGGGAGGGVEGEGGGPTQGRRCPSMDPSSNWWMHHLQQCLFEKSNPVSRKSLSGPRRERTTMSWTMRRSTGWSWVASRSSMWVLKSKLRIEKRATGPRPDSSSSSWRAAQHCCLSSFPWQVSGNLLWQQEDNSHLTDLWKFLNLGGQFLLKTITKDHVPMLWHISKCS